MVLKRNHFVNMVIWLVVIAFMTYKSIEHTIKVHDQGVGVAIKEYKMQSQARISYINTMASAKEIRTATLTDLFVLIKQIKNQMNPYDYIRLNEQLTRFIDLKVDSFLLTATDRKNLLLLQENVKLESMVFHAHLNSFNRLIQRFPYEVLSAQYPIIIFENVPTMNGVIVER